MLSASLNKTFPSFLHQGIRNVFDINAHAETTSVYIILKYSHSYRTCISIHLGRTMNNTNTNNNNKKLSMPAMNVSDPQIKPKIA